MSSQKIRGWSGVVIGLLGVVLSFAGPGLFVRDSAAACKDSPACRAVNSVSGFVGPGPVVTVSSSTAKCEGDCNGGMQTCKESSWDNGDGTRTFQCTCDPETSPASCSGFATIRKADGECTNFACMGYCDPGNPPAVPPIDCRRHVYDIVNGGGCPAPVTSKVRCECE